MNSATKIFMKKRGALPLKYLYRLIAFFVIIGIFTYAGRIYGSGEAYYKLAIAKILPAQCLFRIFPLLY